MRKHSPIIRQLVHGWQQPGWLNRLLLPLSWLNAGIMRLHRGLYGRGILTPGGVDVPVIVVGNLSVGGTGKTPLVLALAEHLVQRGWRPGLISRGYGGEGLQYPALVNDRHTALQVGDEALMMHQADLAPVAVGRDRQASCRLLVMEQGCNIIVSDDGFQHLRLRREIDIVVVDGERGFGNGWCLPSGPLREPRAALSRASMLVVNTNQGGGGEIDLDELGRGLSIPAYQMKIVSKQPYALADRSQTCSLQDFARERPHAFAGLGNPRRFFQTLERAGLDVECHEFPDHHRFRAADFATLSEGQSVIMTEKDAVKCRRLLHHDALDPDLVGRIWVLPVAAEPDAGFYTAIDERLVGLPTAKQLSD